MYFSINELKYLTFYYIFESDGGFHTMSIFFNIT